LPILIKVREQKQAFSKKTIANHNLRALRIRRVIEVTVEIFLPHPYGLNVGTLERDYEE
jgi:hypothetical protein